MTENTVSEIERMVVTRVLMPTQLVWRRGQTEVRDAVVGTEWALLAVLSDGFSRWEENSLLHEDAGWARSFWNAGEYHEIVAREDRFLHVLFGLGGKQG